MTEKIYFKNDNNDNNYNKVEKPIDQEILTQKEIFIKNTEHYEKEFEGVGGEEEFFVFMEKIEESKIKNILNKLGGRFEKVIELSKMTWVVSIAPICLGSVAGLVTMAERQNINNPFTAGLSVGGSTFLLELAFIARFLYQEYKLQKKSNDKWWERDKRQSA